jgi:exocyst complex component 2
MEIEFLHQTLTAHLTPRATSTLSEVYAAISQSYVRPSDGVAGGEDELQKGMEMVKRILSDSKRSTMVEFMCLKKQPVAASSSTSGAGAGTGIRDARERKPSIEQRGGSGSAAGERRANRV